MEVSVWFNKETGEFKFYIIGGRGPGEGWEQHGTVTMSLSMTQPLGDEQMTTDDELDNPATPA